RSSRSFSRFMVSLASGSAIVVKIVRMAVATISSISVNPAELFLRLSFPLSDRTNRRIETFYRGSEKLLNINHGLRGRNLDSLHPCIARAAFRYGYGRLPGISGHEREGHHRALSRNPGRPRRTRGRYLHGSAGCIVAVDQGHGLTVLRQEASVRNIHELKLAGIVVDLHRNGINILSAGEQQIHSKGRTAGNIDRRRIKHERGTAWRRGCAGRSLRSWPGRRNLCGIRLSTGRIHQRLRRRRRRLLWLSRARG